MYTTSEAVPNTYEVGLTLFLIHIIRSPKHPIHTHLIATLLSQVQLERDGETINRSTVRECVDVLLRLHNPEREGGRMVYTTDFEPEFLRRSGEFYKREAEEMLEGGDAGAYLRNVSVKPIVNVWKLTTGRTAAGRRSRSDSALPILQHPASAPRAFGRTSLDQPFTTYSRNARHWIGLHARR